MVTVYAWVMEGEILYKVNRWGLTNGGPAVYLDRKRALKQQDVMEKNYPGCTLIELSGQ